VLKETKDEMKFIPTFMFVFIDEAKPVVLLSGRAGSFQPKLKDMDMPRRKRKKSDTGE